MESNNFVDAIATDDSDIFLFGGSNVLKNFFSSKNHTEIYRKSKFERLTVFISRLHLIAFSSLVGSDYFIGIKGLGAQKAADIILNISKGVEIE